MNTLKLKNTLNLVGKMIQYNFRIIFGGRFIWFLLAAFAFFAFVAIMAVWNGELPDEEFVYDTLLFPAILLIFYPMTFGIQNDLDAGILEILFGIPDYRYKVWLVRLVLVFVLVFLLLIGFAGISYIFLTPVNLFEMTRQLMFPVFFLGGMAFMFSTIIKNGNGTAVVMVILGVFLLIISEATERTMWNIFMNPFNPPRNMNEMIWEGIALKNRIFLVAGTLVFILYGLFNLQKRERFI
ncbi:hypothetical protein [Sunxiuqinia dokdonensis]|uniref:Uncharacterized protein n=1 Tax=Sunxiuqinia dokdonensis TaxID=1409788 RepID=A0A0L8VDX8_9BACT|nr:hypothetical protein [Sunxiuqinia dokdonensis]KOH46646.1 hypothetical protein NC99_04860 [Sunxiuqinia dokdonensis]